MFGGNCVVWEVTAVCGLGFGVYGKLRDFGKFRGIGGVICHKAASG